ncbi:MAG: carboxypeptidase regulatory-like domain-containing protein, partial [Bdellovibrionales bacterium]
MRKLALLILTFILPIAFAQAPVSVTQVSGSLVEKGTRKPISGANVYAFSPPENVVPVKATTDAMGVFTIAIPQGPVRWKISVADYKVYEKTEATVPPSAQKFYLEKNSYLVYETTVFGQEEKRDDKTKTLTRDQFMTLPGANGDPVKAIQNLPGVNRGNGSGAQVIIEGSAPNDTRYNINTQPVPIIFHFNGLSSVVMPEAVDHVDYLSAGFGPEYGQTIAGMVNLYTKQPETDRTHAMGYVDIFNIGGMVEKPLSDHSSIFIGVRKSYVGQVLKLALKNNDSFNLTVAPDFDDAVIMYTNKIDANNSFKLTTIGSLDTIGFVLPEPADQDPSFRGNFSATTTFYRFIPEYAHKFDAATTGRVWLGIGQDSQKVDFANLYYHTDTKVFSGRTELEHSIKPWWKSYVGLENNINLTNVSFQIPFSDDSQSGTRGPIGGAAIQEVSKNYFIDAGALYWRNVMHDESSAWTFLPGLRVGYYNLTREVLPEPRAGVRYAMAHGLTLRSSAGMYDEAPPPQNLDEGFGNPNLKSQKAVHVTLGAEKDFRENGSTGWILSTDLFYKYLYNLVQNSSARTDSGRPEYYNNN